MKAFSKHALRPPKHELNELDWKSCVSQNNKRLADHLCAFANYPGGGFLVFGVNASGLPYSVDDKFVANTVNTLANIARDGVEPPVSLDHSVEEFEGESLLFVFITESPVKPVHLRGRMFDSSVRVCATTRKASENDLRSLMLNSQSSKWETLRASNLLSEAEIPPKLNTKGIFRLLDRKETTTSTELMQWLVDEKFVIQEPSGDAYLTNLGVISAANTLNDFPDLGRKAVRVIQYAGLDKSRTTMEQTGAKGYAVGFEGLLGFIMKLVPKSEEIHKALREEVPIYPEIALREIIANALIHQDFTISGAGPLIEIFSDRIEVSNPGTLLPSKATDRLIGTQPESRNQELANAFRRYRICEERGSGLVKAGLQMELAGLPPIEFFEGPNFFKVTVFSPRTFAQMSAQERRMACYQHATLKHLSRDVMTNKTLRERLKMSEKQRSLVSILIQECVDSGLVKRADPESKSKKYSEYVPHWA